MRVLIVDDEPVARKLLREELELLSVAVAGEADNGKTALEQIASVKPDAVFLDIQMPVTGGFELLSNLSLESRPAVVMLTAYDQHAVRAFEAGAVDYLLKPVSQKRLALAVDRLRRVSANAVQASQQATSLRDSGMAEQAPLMRKIVGKIGSEYFLLNTNEILAFQADGDLTWIITSKQRYLATQNLRAMESRLRDGSFRRIHRNALVNIESVRKLSMITNQRWMITLQNGQEFIVSKRQARSVRDVLHW